MKVVVEIRILKVDDKDKPESTTILQSVWNNEHDQVKIILGGHCYTLPIDELRAALDACQCGYQFYVPRR